MIYYKRVSPKELIPNMPISKEYTIGLLLLLATIFSTWLVISTNNQASTYDPMLHHPDAIAEDVTTMQMDATGHVQYYFSSPRMLHYSDNKTIDFYLPNMTMYNTDSTAQPWKIQARYGRALDDHSQVHLWGNVRAHQATSAKSPETTLLTTAVTLYPNKKYVASNQLVTAIQPGLVAQAVGIEIDLNKNITYLLSKVKGHYEPAKP
jgi:lipopolysaccharide export system protein LptC